MNDHQKSDGDAFGTVVAVMYSCRSQWTELQATEQADVRFCSDCRQSVLQVRTSEGLVRAAAAHECVYVAARGPRGPFVGEVKLVDYPVSSPLNWDE